jgi:hypothetical protein
MTFKNDYKLKPADSARIKCSCGAQATTGQNNGGAPFWYHCDECAEVGRRTCHFYGMTAEEIKAAWAWETSGGVRHTYEFHGPHGEYRHNLGGACCMWSAKAEGWSQIIHAGETLTNSLIGD